ncbi:MAG: cob(I)yrinic acid a,c-diamide adenosyltransferase [Deltaproteobacteria bacterium]|nr:cob(I)yrinic acid a,c-diamide adenosyltransferase [Deltaproteobacteria bacterium]
MTFRINRVYTRSGDKGETGLVGGKRVRKDDARVAAYGDVDELNSAIGLAKERLTAPTASLRPLLEYIQQELFDLGSELATPPEAEYPGMWRAAPSHAEQFERLCDRYGEALPELTSFILPGGSELAAMFHLARTICRRAERTVVTLNAREGDGGEHVMIYLNRLSDLLFVLSRWVLAAEGKDAPLWTRGEHRKLPE